MVTGNKKNSIIVIIEIYIKSSFLNRDKVFDFRRTFATLK